MVRSCQSAGAFFMEGGMYDGHHQQARRPDCVTEVRMGNTGLTVCDTSANGVGQRNNLSCKARAFLQ